MDRQRENHSANDPSCPNRSPSPTIGRIVHYVMPHGGRWVGEHRTAIVADALAGAPNGVVNLQVFKGQAGDFANCRALVGDTDEIAGHLVYHPDGADRLERVRPRGRARHLALPRARTGRRMTGHGQASPHAQRRCRS